MGVSKDITLVAKLPGANNDLFVKKLWQIATYFRDEVGVRVNLIIDRLNEGDEPYIIVLNDKISLRSDLYEIIDRIADKLAYDIADARFLEKVAASTLIKH